MAINSHGSSEGDVPGPPKPEVSTRASRFFKIILTSDPKLRLPVKFLKEYGHDLPSTVSLKVPLGTVWEVEVSYSNGEAWLLKGFEQFKEYYSIGIGYFLVFSYDDAESCFDVLIFDTRAVEIEYPCDPSEQEDRNNFVGRSFPLNEGQTVDSGNTAESQEKITCNEAKGRRQQEATLMEEGVSIEVSDDLSMERNAKRKREVAEDEASIETLDDFLMCKTAGEMPEISSWQNKNVLSRTRNSSKTGVTPPNDQSETIQTRMVKCKEKAQGGGAFPSMVQDSEEKCLQGTGKRRGSWRSRGAETAAYRRAMAFTSKWPPSISFHIQVMQPSYVSAHCTTCFPLAFAKKLSNLKRFNVALSVSDGRTWKVGCCVGPQNMKMHWRNFVKDNDLKLGDVCIFKRLSSRKSSLNVIIVRN